MQHSFHRYEPYLSVLLQRKVYVEDSGFKYWDQVDARLELIREKVKKDDEKINR